MTPLDLSIAPPRAPRAQRAGIRFMPRTIDKLRQAQHGGKVAGDDDVAAYVTGMVTPEQIDAWNAMIAARKVQGGDRAKAVANYPYLADRAEIPLALDNLVEDDARLFA